MTAQLMKLNLGSGKFPLPGWVNVDAFGGEVQIKADFRDLNFDGDVEAVRMSHVLEHISWRETVPLLRRIRDWMIEDGEIIVEVPDMDGIMALGTSHPLWFKYVYGDQTHAGEYHCAGFTAGSLCSALQWAGWQNAKVRKFMSDHPGRVSMPCLEAVAQA